MSEYMPTTETIRAESIAYLSTEEYDSNPEPLTEDEAAARFDRWLAERDRQVKAEALREAAYQIADTHVKVWLYGLAIDIENGDTDD